MAEMKRAWKPAFVALAGVLALLVAVVEMRAQRGVREEDDPEIAALLGAPIPSVTPEQYTARYRAFDGSIWVRLALAAPSDVRYRISVSAEVKPYGAEFVDAGE